LLLPSESETLGSACSESPDSALLVAGKCSFTGSKLRLSDSSRLDSENSEQALGRACSAFPYLALLVAGKCSFTGSKLRLSDSSRLDSENSEQALGRFQKLPRFNDGIPRTRNIYPYRPSPLRAPGNRGWGRQQNILYVPVCRAWNGPGR
jgi:hypothetical protein